MLLSRKVAILCTAKIHDYRTYEFVSNLSRHLSTEGIILFVYNISTDLYWSDNMPAEASVYDLIDWKIADIVIVMDEKIKSHLVTESVLSKAKKHNVPAVIVDGVHPDAFTVGFDYESGFEEVVRHMIEDHAYKDVHFLAGIPGNNFSDRRIEIFRKVLEENNIAFSPEMISYGYFWSGPAKKAVQLLADNKKIPRALICANDNMALDALEVLQENGISCPDECAVSGFDGMDSIYFSTPQLTSSHCSHAKLAEAAAKTVLKILHGEKISKSPVLVRPEIILAQSCGCRIGHLPPPEYLVNLSNRYFEFPDETRAIFRVLEKMQTSNSLNEASETLRRDLIYSLTVMVNKSYTSPYNEPNRQSAKHFEDTMCVFYDSEAGRDFEPYDIDRSEIIPNLKQALASSEPLIFTALDFVNVTFGYMCFHFSYDDILNYSRIPMIVTALRNSIGGFAHRQYQRYLGAQMEELYKTDSLTGLYNRSGFNRVFEYFTERLKKSKGPVTVVLSDLDRLKQINDLYGHSAGDKAIQESARAFKLACPEDALCVRFGGDELLAVIEGDVDTDALKKKIADYLDSYNEISGKPYKVKSSIGVFKTTGADDIGFETLVRRADESMYKEKEMHHKSENSASTFQV
ncbi:MAG TPA: hypothetical protein DCZ74_00960 [Treponema sp.]|nr:hypothetical protein [Treponema sp.]